MSLNHALPRWADKTFLKTWKKKKKKKSNSDDIHAKSWALSSFQKQFSLNPASTGFFSLVFKYHGKDVSASGEFSLSVSLKNTYHMK